MTLIAGESLQYTLFEQKCHIPILQGDPHITTNITYSPCRGAVTAYPSGAPEFTSGF
jgi:hypothetical protein